VLVTEQDILNFQTCPRKYALAKAAEDQQISPSITSLQEFMAVWMWTYQVIHGQKCSVKALKEKWANIVTKSYIKNEKFQALSSAGETIASGFPLVRSLYERYLESRYHPAATMLPTRYTIPHVGTIQSIVQVVVLNDLGNTVVLNFSDDRYRRDTLTNLIFLIRLAAACQNYDAIQLVNTRLNSHLTTSHILALDLKRSDLLSNLEYIVLAMKSGINYPILNCRLSCEYISECY
jgi:hypothetical protein